MPKGFWMLVLHAHLPYVKHPEYKDALEERWLYEAITETYLPLLNVFERLMEEGIDYRLTMSVTPPLANMLADPLLQNRYVAHIEKLIELAGSEVIRTKYVPELYRTAVHYYERFQQCYNDFVYKHNKNLLNTFRLYQDLGRLELITCNATHGFLPLLESYPNAVRAQVITGIKDYERNFGRSPNGIWNGECGYYPGEEVFMKEGGIKYFFVDSHAVLHSSEKPAYGVFAPLETENGIAYFARDFETSYSVWSAEHGYPGDPLYREFYRDVGFDLEYEYVRPYLHESGIRISTGMKYHRVTDKNLPIDKKEYYDPKAAFERTVVHGENFVFNREKQIDYISTMMDRKPLIVSMYDAELFGHWWYEGPEFIYNILKKMYYSDNIKTITPTEYLKIYPNSQSSSPPMSSWGFKGYNEFWLNDRNDWIYPHIHKASERMIELANKYKDVSDWLVINALNQSARELLLMQSSDWAFIMKTGTMVEYAEKRTKDHIGRFNKLYEMIKTSSIDKQWLYGIMYKDAIFPDMDFKIYADKWRR